MEKCHIGLQLQEHLWLFQKLNPGSYDMRVGAFSEVSGSWEYNDYFPVIVQ